MGGYPVSRNSKSNTVDQISKIYSTNTEFRLALSPEGTRKKVKKWKSGFYFIAKKAKVPIICVSLNYIDKNVNFSQPSIMGILNLTPDSFSDGGKYNKKYQFKYIKST